MTKSNEHNNAPAVPQGNDPAWTLAAKVREALDRKACPGYYMDVAVEAVVHNYIYATSAQPAHRDPYTTIDMGHGKFEVGAGKNGGLPCIAFGRNGTGKVGEPITTGPRQMSGEETFAVITFANVTGLDVLQEKMDQVREEFFPGTTPQFSATPAPAPAQEVATLPLSAEDVHAAFTKNFPKSRISQAWINFAADIAQAIAARAAKPAQEVVMPTDKQIIQAMTAEFPTPSLVPMLKGSVICGDFHKALVSAVNVGIAEFCRINGIGQPAQEVGLTDEEIEDVFEQHKGAAGKELRATIGRAIIAALRAKGGK